MLVFGPVLVLGCDDFDTAFERLWPSCTDKWMLRCSSNGRIPALNAMHTIHRVDWLFDLRSSAPQVLHSDGLARECARYPREAAAGAGAALLPGNMGDSAAIV